MDEFKFNDNSIIEQLKKQFWVQKKEISRLNAIAKDLDIKITQLDDSWTELTYIMLDDLKANASEDLLANDVSSLLGMKETIEEMKLRRHEICRQIKEEDEELNRISKLFSKESEKINFGQRVFIDQNFESPSNKNTTIQDITEGSRDLMPTQD